MSVRSLNKVMLIGNLTRDPEMKYTANGTAVTTFGMATNRSWRDSNGELQESAQFHNIVAWAKMAEICHQILSKGMMVYVEGELNTRSWDGDDGVTRYKTEIRVSEMKLLDSKGKDGVGGGEEGSSSQSSGGGAGDDIPADDMPADDMPVEDPSDDGPKDEDPIEDDLPF